MIRNFTRIRKTVIDKGQQPSRICMTGVMKMRLFPLILSVALLATTPAFGQSIPSWKSVTQTGNVRDLVLSAGSNNSVAAWLGKKADTTNGQLQNPSMRGGSASGTDISAAVAVASSTKIARSLSAHFGDTLNLADYGVVCDGTTDNAANLQAALTAAGTSSKYANGVKIIVPFGICYSSVGVSIMPSDSRSFGISGGGMGASTLQFAAGGLFVTINEVGSLSVSHLHIQRNASTAGDVGLFATGTSGGVDGLGQVDLNSVRVDGVTRANSFATGVHIHQASVNASNLFTQLADSAEDGTPTTITSGLEISGTPSNNTATQEGYLWSIDDKITNSTFQGGYNGVFVHGAVQGVFITNSEALGNTKGVNWEGGGYDNYPELFFVSNFHGNNHICGVCTTGQVDYVTVTGSLLLHFNDSIAAWTGISLSDGQQAEITGNTSHTSGTAGSETFISLTNYNFSTVQGNSTVTLNGPIVSLSGSSSYDIVTGNMGNSISTYTGPQITGCYDPSESGARYRQCFNNLLNNVRDVYVDDSQSLHISSSGILKLDSSSGAQLSTLISTTGSIDASIGNNLYRLIISPSISSELVCPDTTDCALGNSGNTLHLAGYPILPSLTKVAILALSSPVVGMIVNDTTDNVPVIYENGHWYPMTLGPALQ